MYSVIIRTMFLGVAVLLCTACGFGFSQRATPTPIALALPTAIVTSQDVTVPVVRGNIAQEESFAGKVTLAVQEDLFFRRSGRVAEVYVQNGEDVEADTLIAALDTRALELDLESSILSLAIAQERLAAAESDRILARQTAELNLQIAQLRLDTLLQDFATEDGTATDQARANQIAIGRHQVKLAQLALDNVEDEVNPTLGLDVQRAELAVEKLKESLLEAQITAPFAGRVRFISLEEEAGTVASSYEAVARLTVPSSFEIEANLTRQQLEPLREGMAVSVALTGGSQPLSGKIAALPAPYGTGTSQLVRISVSEEAADSLREGATVDVSVSVGEKTAVLLIPSTALFGVGDQRFVILVEEGNREEVDVQIGARSDSYVEVVGGLSEGHMVVARQ